MKIKSAKPEYLEAAKHISEDIAEQLLSRINDKLYKKLKNKELSTEEVIGIQLEIEEAQLVEWRTKVAEIRKKEEKKKNKVNDS